MEDKQNSVIEKLLIDNESKIVGISKNPREILILPEIILGGSLKQQSTYCHLNNCRVGRLISVKDGYIEIYFRDGESIEERIYLPINSLIITKGNYSTHIDFIIKKHSS